MELKHLDKIYDKASGATKADVLEYYAWAAPLILPHVKDKPFSMIHFPHGVGEHNFYQKQRPSDAPEWLKGVRIESGGERGYIDWCLVNDADSMLYMANRGVLEMHTWFSALPDLDTVTSAVIDIDPPDTQSFAAARTLAKAFCTILEELKLHCVAKLSGSRGIHLHISITPTQYAPAQEFLTKLCSLVRSAYPDIATLERAKEKRDGKVYLDAVQFARGKTLAAPYSLRARENLPVAAPITKKELSDDTLTPNKFTIKTIRTRISKVGDLFSDFFDKAAPLPKL